MDAIQTDLLATGLAGAGAGTLLCLLPGALVRSWRNRAARVREKQMEFGYFESRLNELQGKLLQMDIEHKEAEAEARSARELERYEPRAAESAVAADAPATAPVVQGSTELQAFMTKQSQVLDTFIGQFGGTVRSLAEESKQRGLMWDRHEQGLLQFSQAFNELLARTTEVEERLISIDAFLQQLTPGGGAPPLVSLQELEMRRLALAGASAPPATGAAMADPWGNGAMPGGNQAGV